MSYRTCTDVVDGDTFVVRPKWTWRTNSGDRVRIAGFDAPEIDTEAGRRAKERLETAILRKRVELRDYQSLSHGRLVCDVHVGRVDVRGLL